VKASVPRFASKTSKRIDVSSGTGSSEKYIKKYLPNVSIFSIDISEESIRVAKKENESFSDIVFETFDGVNIRFDRKFDIIFIANVFHHISRAQQYKSMKAINSKVSDSGFLMMFEHNPINPLTLWVAYHSDYKFDKEAKLLHPLYCRKLLNESGFKKRMIRFIVFFPGFLMCLNKFEKYLHKLPIGAQYYYIARK